MAAGGTRSAREGKAWIAGAVLVAAAFWATLPAQARESLADCLTPMASLAGPEAIASPTCFGVRPGARISIQGAGCSLNFIFTDATRTYAGTAGHCGTVGQRVSARVSAQESLEFGTIMVSSLDVRYVPVVTEVEEGFFGYRLDAFNTAVGTDFALIQVDADKTWLVNPAMCYWGGPTGLASAKALGVGVRHYGHGTGVGSTAPTRARSASLSFVDADRFGIVGIVSPGDSGSGARLASGEALGILTHGGPPTPVGGADAPLGLASQSYGTTIEHAIEIAREAGYDIALATAPLAHEDGSALGVWPDPFDW